MKSHLTEFHVCGHVAESPRYVAFRQHLHSLHSLEAESRLSGCIDPRLDVDRPARIVPPRFRPDRNRPSPVGTRAVLWSCSTPLMTRRKTMRTVNRRVSPQQDASTVFASSRRRYDVRRSQQSSFRPLFPAILCQARLRVHQVSQGFCRNAPVQGLSSLGTMETHGNDVAPAVTPQHRIQTTECTGPLHSVNKTLQAAYIIRGLRWHFNHMRRQW